MGTNAFALTDRTKSLNDKFYIILDKIVNSYQKSKVNGLDSINNNIYTENIARMEKLQLEYFLYKNEVEKDSEDMQNAVMNGNSQINALEAQNKVLRVQYENLKSSSHSAEGLFDDAQITRNQLLVSNIILFGIMAGGGFMYYKSLKV
jgi:hypothetical protein